MANTIFFNIFPNDAVASAVAIETENVDNNIAGLFLPRNLILIGQFDPAKTAVVADTPVKISSADDAADRFGFGSLLHRMAVAAYVQRKTTFGVYALPVEDDGAAVDSIGKITITGPSTSAGTLYIYIGGQRVTVAVPDTTIADDIAIAIVAAIQVELALPVTAVINGVNSDEVDITCRWGGVTGNDIDIRLNYAGDSEVENNPAGVSLVIGVMATGANNPDLTTPLANLGSTWFTEIANPYKDSANLALIDSVGEARFGPTEKVPYESFLGGVDDDITEGAFCAALNSKWITNVPVYNSPTPTFEISAESAAIVSNEATKDPARPFKTVVYRNAKRGFDADPWNYLQKDTLEKTGCSVTTINANGNVAVYDFLTTYKTNPQAAPDPSYRYTVTISNIQAKIFSIDSVFSSSPFDRGIVVDDQSVSAKPYAIRPKTCIAYVRDLVDQLWIPQAWSKEREAIMESISAEIDTGNPGRINVQLTDTLSAGLRIIAVKYNFNFSAT